MRQLLVALLFCVALWGCKPAGESEPGSAPITLRDLNGLVFLSPGECPSGPGWEAVTGYSGRFIAVDDSVGGEPSTTDADPNGLVIDLRAPCQGKGRLGVADAPGSTQDPVGGTLCNASRRKGAHTHDHVGFRLCRIQLD